MWRLLKAEIYDARYYLLAFYGFMEFNFLIIAYLEQQKANINSSVSQNITVLLFLYFFIRRYQEKRTRFHQPLPLKVIEISIARLFYPVLFWLGALILYALSYLIFPLAHSQSYLLWRLLSYNSLLLSANAIFLISFDLANGYRQWPLFSKTISQIFLWSYIGASGMFYIEHPLWKMTWHKPFPVVLDFLYFTPAGAVILHSISLGLSVLSVVVYKKRQAYLDIPGSGSC